jgi:hypothetical protein
MALYIRNGKMTSKIGLCREHWKYRSKKTLPQIAHLHCRKSRLIAIGILTYAFTTTIAQVSGLHVRKEKVNV